jgi:F-type H+-transporting ATPase subunit gamma
MKRKVLVEKFLNIGKPQDGNKKVYLNYLLEPNPAEIFAEILPRYCVTRIQTALHEAYASELAARIVAMQTASRNAADMIERLTLVKNKMRQSDITREMIEISSGSENLK